MPRKFPTFVVQFVCNQMESEVKEKILIGAEALFMRLGVRSVTMDDVSRELGMSKKTLYQYFENKDHLVTAVVSWHLDEEREEYSQIALRAENAIDELHQIARCMRENILKMNPTTLYDLKKFHSTAWGLFVAFKSNFIKGNVEENIKKGIAQGYYRENLDAAILAVFRVEQVQLIFDQSIYPSSTFDFARVQIQLFDHFVYGLLTEKGRTLYKEFQHSYE